MLHEFLELEIVAIEMLIRLEKGVVKKIQVNNVTVRDTANTFPFIVIQILSRMADNADHIQTRIQRRTRLEKLM